MPNQAALTRSIQGRRFFTNIAIPIIASTLYLIHVSRDFTEQITDGANQADYENTARVVQSALSVEIDQIRNYTLDNAYWDEAYYHIYLNFEKDWADSTWASSFDSQKIYDHISLYDQNSHSMIFSRSRDGKVTNWSKISKFLESDEILNRNSQMSVRQTMAGYISIDNDIYLLSLSPISKTARYDLPEASPILFVLIKCIDSNFEENISSKYVIKNFNIDLVRKSTSNLSINDIFGRPIAFAGWNDKRPGDAAKGLVYIKAFMSLGILIVVMTFICVLCWNLIRRISAHESSSHWAATHDTLTGLLNRSGLSDAAAAFDGVPLAVVFIDLDGFKSINDTYGHATGDEVIRLFARGIAFLSEPLIQHVISRLGGDEFVVVFAGSDACVDASRLANYVGDFVAQPFDIKGKYALVGASVGISSRIESNIEFSELLRRADVSMYQAKSKGRNNVFSYTTSLEFEMIEIKEIANELKNILQTEEIDIVYQPIVNSDTFAIETIEALARWPAESCRSVPTERFIAVAEGNGLIDLLWEVILKKACRDAIAWPKLRLAVNVSTIQLKNPRFLETTKTIIIDSGIQPSRIEIEITESKLIENIEIAHDILDELRSFGISIVLDDFGSGFASIGYLRNLPFDRIKIDRSLVEGIEYDEFKRSVIEGTLKMAQGISAVVTAEGIEKIEQRNLLKKAGCQNFQGFLFYKPLKACEISEIMKNEIILIADDILL